MILDSSYVFALLSGDPEAQRVGLEMEAEGAMQWLPTPAIAEAYYGAAVARPDAPRDLVGDHLRGYPRLEVDVEVAQVAGELLAATDEAVEGREGGGGVAGAADAGANVAYVAAMAEILDEPVVTADPDPFAALGVDVREV